jgi:hypothetical protein
MQKGIVMMPAAVWTSCGYLKSGHRSKEIKAMIINSSCERFSRQGHVVVAESLGISTDGVEVVVCHGFLGSQAFLAQQVS